MIRGYRDPDYDKLKELYQNPRWRSGVFDEARDGRRRLEKKVSHDPDAILVYDNEQGEVLGTISLVDDGRMALLYRFIVRDNKPKIVKELYQKAAAILKARGHKQVLVYADSEIQELNARYVELGFQKEGIYSCFWRTL